MKNPISTPDRKDERQSKLLEDTEISSGWEKYQHEIEVVTTYFHNSGEYIMQNLQLGNHTGY